MLAHTPHFSLSEAVHQATGRQHNQQIAQYHQAPPRSIEVRGASTPAHNGCGPLHLTWDTDTMVCPGYCEVALGSDFKVTVLSELVMEEGELVAEVVDPGRKSVQDDEAT